MKQSVLSLTSTIRNPSGVSNPKRIKAKKKEKWIKMLTWLDFDDEAMKNAHKMLKQLHDARTLDHLGLSGIRDDFADLFFPATSTIMPHARYLLLVPEAFHKLELELRKKTSSLNAAIELLDSIELAQAQSLISEITRKKKTVKPTRTDLTGSGIIGWEKILDTGGNEFVTQTPSINYWASLRRLGIRTTKGSRSNYVQYLMKKAKTKINYKTSADSENEGNEFAIWHKDAIALSTGENRVGLELNKQQAGFLKNQYLSLNSSLMSKLLDDETVKFSSITNLMQFRYPWDYPLVPDSHREIIEQAKYFSALMQGANLAYGALVLEQHKLEFNNEYKEWLTKLEEWFDDGSSALGIASIKKINWGTIGAICSTRSKDVLFLKNIYQMSTESDTPKKFLNASYEIIQIQEKNVKPVAYRLRKNKWQNNSEIQKHREKLFTQPIRIGLPADYRWNMAAQFMWNMNTGLQKWG